jgi:hypothetical protein
MPTPNNDGQAMQRADEAHAVGRLALKYALLALVLSGFLLIFAVVTVMRAGP